MFNYDREINFAGRQLRDQVLWQSDRKMKVSLSGRLANVNWRQSLPRVRRALAVIPRGANATLGYNEALPEIKVNFVRRLKKNLAQLIVNWSANVAIVAAAVVAVAVFGPRLVAMLKQPSTPVETTATEDVVSQNLLPIEQGFEEFLPQEFVLPRVDVNLPTEDWVRIPALGVDTPILTNESSADLGQVNQILDQGVYKYPEFGDIGNQRQPVVLAAHHMNMVSTPWRDQNTFQNLQNLQVGDRVELMANQRKWIYEVYATREETAVSDEEADLIMYTCVFWWDDELRRVVYARLLDPSTYEVTASMLDEAPVPATNLGVLLTGGEQ